MKIKICGINRPVDVQYINESQPDYVGFIVNFPKSHRSVTYNQLGSLAGRVDAPIKKSVSSWMNFLRKLHRFSMKIF